jgi:tetratricopeptide (TPR) repeat protein
LSGSQFKLSVLPVVLGGHAMRRFFGFVAAVLLVLLVSLPAGAQKEEGRGYYDFGVFAYEDGDYEDAEKNLLKALAFEPDNPYYNHFLGKTYLKKERYMEALKYLSAAANIDPDLSGLKYDLAFFHYKMTEYDKAADLFAEIAVEEPSNVLATYYAGICLFKLKRFVGALDYFISASEESPSVKANGYYYAGICYLKTNDFEKAIEKFQYAKEHANSDSLRASAARWLQAAEQQQKAFKPYSLYFKFGYQYDDNIRLEPLDQDIYADEGDHVTKGYFSGRYNFVNKRDLKIGAGYSHYQTWHNDLTTYDLVGSIYNLYVKYRFDKFSLGCSYLPTYYWVDSDSYLMRHQLKPEITWKIADNLSTRLSYSYHDNNYFQDYDRNGNTHEFDLNVQYSILNNKVHLLGSIGLDDNSASHRDEYYEQLRTKLSISFKALWGINLGLRGRYYDKDYQYNDSVYGVKRKDDKYYGSISVSRQILYKWLGVTAEFNYTKNESNVNNFEYEKKVTAFYITTRF